MTLSRTKPVVGTMIGDPAGIGPEVVLAALMQPQVREALSPVLIGNIDVLRRAAGWVGYRGDFRTIAAGEVPDDEAGILHVYDSGSAGGDGWPLGEDSVAGGLAASQWMRELQHWLDRGDIGAGVIAPISSGSLKLAGRLSDAAGPRPGEQYLVLLTENLRIAHLTDHVPFRDVAGHVRRATIDHALTELDKALRAWGVPHPRIAVAGLNPHAYGREEEEEILPAIVDARARGLDVLGPISPDTVFRMAVEGGCDLVLAHYHDQGHIAVKTAHFSGNCVVIVGPDKPTLTVAHGTAYDIVGRNLADPSMMANAMMTAARFAAGQGFLS